MVQLYKKITTFAFSIFLVGATMSIVLGADTKAKRIRIIDGGAYYTSTEVESALQELGAGTVGPGTGLTNAYILYSMGGVITAEGAFTYNEATNTQSIENISLSGNLVIPDDGLFGATNTLNYFWMGDNTNYNPTSPAAVVTALGLEAGGGRDIWVEKAGDTMVGKLLVDYAISGAVTRSMLEVQSEMDSVSDTTWISNFLADMEGGSSYPSSGTQTKVGYEVDNSMRHNQTGGTYDDYGGYFHMGSLAELPLADWNVDYFVTGLELERAFINVGNAAGGSWNDVTAIGLKLTGWDHNSDLFDGIGGTFTRYAIYSDGGDVFLNDGNVRTSGYGRFDGGLMTGATYTLTVDETTSLTDYLLASDATDRATFASYWTDLTDTGDTTLHDHDGIDENTIHRSSTGTDHGYIDQDVTISSSPTFVTTKLSGLTDDYIPVHTNDATGLENSALTNTNATTLVDNSMADALHRHSELSASDGTPDAAVQVDVAGNIGIGVTDPDTPLEVFNGANSQLKLSFDAANFTELYTDASGDIHIVPSLQYIVAGDGSNVDYGWYFYGNTTQGLIEWNEDDGYFQISGNDATNYSKITVDGDHIFMGTAGHPYGNFYGNNLSWNSTSFGGGGTFVIISSAGIAEDILGGQLNLTTFQNDQELLIANAGDYLINWSLSIKVNGVNKHIEGAIGVNGTANVVGRQHIEAGRANEEHPMSGMAILAVNATDTVSVMVTNVDDNTQVDVHHVLLTCVQVGG